ncbi:MAG: protein tyrosine phosphatase [Bacteroidetes bacterium QS_1_63_11]|nr:MAG: protein tyrosine phosphatase [Bacteroidetes bacterium QS_1_63_11]
MSTQILFVCTGNTCRSPMAEALAEARGVSATSAGVAAAAGDGATPNAVRALRDAQGLSLQDHAPRDVSDVDPAALVTWAIPDPYGGSLDDYRRCLEQIGAALDDLGGPEPT